MHARVRLQMRVSLTDEAGRIRVWSMGIDFSRRRTASSSPRAVPGTRRRGGRRRGRAVYRCIGRTRAARWLPCKPSDAPIEVTVYVIYAF
jgi:hypothetical protein